MLDDHTRLWTTAAHRYAMTISGTGYPEQLLAGLLAENIERLPLDGLDPVDVIILAGLSDYHPAVLAVDLSVASANLPAAVSNAAEGG
jgi:hypothetical protein